MVEWSPFEFVIDGMLLEVVPGRHGCVSIAFQLD